MLLHICLKNCRSFDDLFPSLMVDAINHRGVIHAVVALHVDTIIRAPRRKREV